ncbi:hypothetical protein BH10PLA2_BH10PLA2_16490 [soil metagenome]
MHSVATIVDRGRGPQLSTSRITVQDLLLYLQEKVPVAEIIQMMPVLTLEDIQVIEQYIHNNFDSVMEQSRRIQELNATHIKPESIQAAEHIERLKRLEQIRQSILQKKQGLDAHHIAGG